MKPGLVLPRVYTTDAIQADRIDDHIRLMAEQINGGLTRDNLAPSLKLGNGVFVESSAPTTMSVAINGAAGGFFSIIGVPFVAVKVLSIGYHIAVVANPAAPRTLIVRSGANNIIQFLTTAASTTKASNGSTIVTGIFSPDMPASTMAAGALILANISVSGSDTQIGTITLTLTTVWTN
jgi:hypothetical protein